MTVAEGTISRERLRPWCKSQENLYVLAMIDLAMTITGNLVSRGKFLEDEEATLRSGLHDLAASLVSKNI